MCKEPFWRQNIFRPKEGNMLINQSASNTVIREDGVHLKDNECCGRKKW